jgi:hypothetical protein
LERGEVAGHLGTAARVSARRGVGDLVRAGARGGARVRAVAGRAWSIDSRRGRDGGVHLPARSASGVGDSARGGARWRTARGWTTAVVAGLRRFAPGAPSG